MRSVRRWAAVAVGRGGSARRRVLALALSASPASAFSEWAHDGATGCSVTPGHADRRHLHRLPHRLPELPGRDLLVVPRARARTRPRCPRRARPAARSATCGTPCRRQYITPTTHGTNPHLGSSPGVPRLPPDQRQHLRSRLQPASQRAGHRVHRLRRVPLARRRSTPARSPAPRATRRAVVPPVHGQQPRLQELRRLPHHEARRQEGRRPASARPATRAGSGGARAQHSRTITKKFVCGGVPHQEAARQRRQQGGQELPHLPQRQVPRRAADAVQVGVHALPQRRHAARQRLPVHAVPPARRPQPPAQRRQPLIRA